MIQNTARKVTNSIQGFFSKPETQSQFILPYTRFSTSAELKGIAEVLEKLFAKKEAMKKIADEKGAQSNEFATFTTLEAILADTNKAIIEFNQAAIKPDVLANMKDIYELTVKLKPIASVTEEQQATLNSVTADKLNAKSTAASAALFAAPFIPALLLGPGVFAVALGVGAFVAAKPASDYLIANGLITFDAESKVLMASYLDLIDKTNKNLEKFLADNNVAVENSNMTPARPA